MKKVAIMQPYLFPYLGYFQILNAVDEYVLFDDVQHIKRGWVNRNNILVNGESSRFTISLNGASTTKNINEITIADDFSKFLKTVSLAYAKAPYYKDVYQLLEHICSYNKNNLSVFIANSLKEICQYLEIDTKISFSSQIEKDNKLKAQDKIIAICKQVKADMYINAIGGQDLYEREYFKSNDIELKFLRTRPVEYKQFTRDFIPNLSIIDIMMFNSTIDVRKLMLEYDLI